MSIIVVTGIQAAGKSSVAEALAQRFDRSVHVRGDLFRRMVVNGRSDMGPADPPAEAVRQLHLRYRLAATVAQEYAGEGFTVVLQDVAIAEHLDVLLGHITHRPLALVVLAPDPEVVIERDAERRRLRGKVAYRAGDEGVREMDAALRARTPRLGAWVDSSHQGVDETVEEILGRLGTDARLP